MDASEQGLWHHLPSDNPPPQILSQGALCTCLALSGPLLQGIWGICPSPPPKSLLSHGLSSVVLSTIPGPALCFPIQCSHHYWALDFMVFPRLAKHHKNLETLGKWFTLSELPFSHLLSGHGDGTSWRWLLGGSMRKQRWFADPCPERVLSQ